MGYNGLSRQSKIRQEIPLPLKRMQAPEEACFPVNYSLKQEPNTSSSLRTKCHEVPRATTCHRVPRADGRLTFIWSVTSCSPSTSERCRLNGRKASDWLRPYAPNWALSDFAGRVRLMSSDGRDLFEPFRFLIPSKLEGSEVQSTKKQAVLLMHDTYITTNIRSDFEKDM